MRGFFIGGYVTVARRESMLTGIQKNPNLFSRLARYDAGERCVTTLAGVVLLKHDMVVHVPACIREMFVCAGRRWPTMKVGAVRTGLYPEIHCLDHVVRFGVFA